MRVAVFNKYWSFCDSGPVRQLSAMSSPCYSPTGPLNVGDPLFIFRGLPLGLGCPVVPFVAGLSP